MPWQSVAQPQQPRSAAPVPVGESVRLAALQAAWKRDRQVGRRRLWWRWAVWGAQRYVLPAAAGLGLCAGLWFAAKATLGWLDLPTPAEPAVATAPATASPAPTNTENQIDPVLPSPSITVVTSSGMALAFESRLPDPTARPNRPAQTPVSSAALPDVAKIPNPQLISENWLHSKEP
ncbi:hypothetical protein LPB72_07440 [Hydrogenophaga crassostreae]|uniref:Uncharacterized protein n=1 Tax=Hydrogenophaga crassostreae TaxID=1763535 RepID=A0ABX2U8S8_9BURK|nr:hypothetical protein [Hydrogenophaga crassostreae]OAD42733.1 hypothetical protein LPB72_07440 [Hydrogenophaga crassostreae]